MFKIALRNILRNIRRTVLTGMSITAAVMIVVYLWSFISGVINNSLDNFIRSSSGHIRILKADYLRREKMLPLGTNIPDYTSVQKIADAHPAVTLSQGRIKFGVLLENKGENKPVMGIGIDPDKEDKISNLGMYLIEGRKVILSNEEINIGDRLAKEFGLKLGDTLTVVTQTAYGSLAAMNLKIVGIFRLGIPSIDSRIFYMPLDKAQQLLDLDNRVTEIFLLVKNANKAPQIAKEIAQKLDEQAPGKFAVIPWQEQGVIYFWMRLTKFIYGVIYLVILLLASFTILNTMFMAVLERTPELGMMKALGLKNRQVVKLILLEAMLIGIFAGFIGSLSGAGISYYLSTRGIDFSGTFNKLGGTFNFPVPYIYRATFSWGIVFTGFFFGVVFSILAALPASLRAAKMEPREALHEI